MATDTWIIVNHSLWKKPAALVGLQNKQFKGYIPLLDPRDADGDGKVSTGEWLVSKMPIFGNLSREAEISSVMMMIALDERVMDVQLYGEGQRRLLAAAVVAIEQSISMLYIKQIAGPAAALVLSGTTLTGVSYFVAKKGLETVFKKMIDRALGLP
ncbi:MAG: hypothetical protein RKO24_06290 [Candidatus Competibacter sp.]|nr:hypothetical protein [Candidatus Contendobacter sp.]MDS4069212.1 hypothetical protein [Candidatus Competibacter sp.]